MIAQIYVVTDNNNTSTVVSNQRGDVYFYDVMDYPELTGIQRGVSFVKHNLKATQTEIFTDKLDINEVLKDAYINYCKVNPVAGKEVNEKAYKFCQQSLAIHNRWNEGKTR